MKLPCKEKYVTERVPKWIAIPSNAVPDNYYVCHEDDWTENVFIGLTAEHAEEIVKIHNEYVDKLVEYMTRKP